MPCDTTPSLTILATQVHVVESRLQGLLRLSDRAIVDMLSRRPTLLGYQSKQLQAMREYLGGRAGLSDADIASLLQKEPRILSHSLAGVLGDFHYALLCMCPQCLLVEAGSAYLSWTFLLLTEANSGEWAELPATKTSGCAQHMPSCRHQP